MHRFAVFFLVGVVIMVMVKADINVRHCFETVVLNDDCCQFNVTEETSAILTECAEKSGRDLHTCDFETCYGQKFGLLLSNGTVDRSSLEKFIEKDYENNTDIMNMVKEKCLIDDLASYGPPHMCDIKKVVHCISFYTVLHCPHWSDAAHCNKVRDVIRECQSVYP